MKTSFFLIALFLAYASFAQDNTIAPKYSNEFLSIGVGADALGMGNAFAAETSGASSVYWNPAGLIKVDKWLEIGFMHSSYFAGIAKYDVLNFAHKLDDKSAIGFGAIRFGVDDIPNTTQLIDNNGNINYDNITTFSAGDYAFLFSYARALSVEGMSVGGTAKIIHRKIGDFAKCWGFGIDAGMLYEYSDKWKFAAVIRDASSTFNAWMFDLDQQMQQTFIATGNELPQNGLELTLPRIILAANGNFDLGKSGLYAGGEIDLDITTDGARNTLVGTNVFSIDPHFGLKFGFKDFFVLRGGISNMQYVSDLNNNTTLNVQPNIGVGVAFKGFHLDYAFTDIGDASVALYSHVISLRLRLNKPKNAVK
ncbi:MAG: PorV/PorQ family protein [Crocinitomicaceae bacterium]|nr:PorV/PorQ family protein [Crocinitomicaceae bacterium]